MNVYQEDNDEASDYLLNHPFVTFVEDSDLEEEQSVEVTKKFFFF